VEAIGFKERQGVWEGRWKVMTTRTRSGIPQVRGLEIAETAARGGVRVAGRALR